VRGDPSTFCHNDFHEANMLVEPAGDGWRLVGVLDFANAVSGDPTLDLAKTIYYSVRRDQAKRAGLLAGYGPPPDDWLTRARSYQLMHALELWVWFMSAGHPDPKPVFEADMWSLLADSPDLDGYFAKQEDFAEAADPPA